MKWVSIREFRKLLNTNTQLYHDIYVKETLTDKLLSKFGKEITETTLEGTLDGNGQTVHNISTQLFDEISDESVLKNLTVSQSSIEGPALCRTNHGEIQNVKVVTKNAQNSDSSELGGLVSINNGEISNCTFEGAVRGELNVGGISGLNKGFITDCVVQNSTINNAKKSGGVTGANHGQIESCSSKNITVEGYRKIGGISGVNKGVIEEGETINSTIEARNTAGGVTGTNGSTISNCVVTQSSIEWVEQTSVKNTEGYNFGGIIGSDTSIGWSRVKTGDMSDKATVTQCSFNNSTVEGRKEVGGLVGTLNSGKITKCEIIDGLVTGEKTVGGACGLQENGHMEEICIECKVNGESHVGGISGWVNNLSVCTSIIFAGSIPDDVTECGKLFSILKSQNVSECYYAGEPTSGMLAVYNTEKSDGLHDSSGLSVKEVLSIMTV